MAISMDSAFTIPMFGRIESFWIVVAVVVVSSVWEWLKKQRKTGRTGSPGGGSEPFTSSPPATAPRPAATSDWEAELRRLLGGESPVANPPPTAPPLIRTTVIQEAKPVSSARPTIVATPMVRTPPPPSPETRITTAEKSVDVHRPALQESAAAYHRASHLQEEVAKHLKGVDEMTERHLAGTGIVPARALSVEAAQTIALIRNPRTARQAVIASLIFGPPKALAAE